MHRNSVFLDICGCLEKKRNRKAVQKLNSSLLNPRLNYNTLQYSMVLHQDMHAVASNCCFLSKTWNFSKISFCFFQRQKAQVLNPSQLSLESSSEDKKRATQNRSGPNCKINSDLSFPNSLPGPSLTRIYFIQNFNKMRVTSIESR